MIFPEDSPELVIKGENPIQLLAGNSYIFNFSCLQSKVTLGSFNLTDLITLVAEIEYEE
jgi:hypothetical protein